MYQLTILQRPAADPRSVNRHVLDQRNKLSVTVVTLMIKFVIHMYQVRLDVISAFFSFSSYNYTGHTDT